MGINARIQQHLTSTLGNTKLLQKYTDIPHYAFCTPPPLQKYTITPVQSHTKIQPRDLLIHNNKVAHSPSSQGILSCFRRIRRFKSPQEIPSVRNALIDGIIPYETLLDGVKAIIHRNPTYSRQISILCQASNNNVTQENIIEQEHERLLAVSKWLTQYLDAHQGYPRTQSTNCLHYSIFSELAEQHAIKTGLKTTAQDSQTHAQNDIISDSLKHYSHTEKIALYLILSLIQQEGGTIDDNILIDLEKNIREEQSLIDAKKTDKKNKKLYKMNNELQFLKELKHLPHHNLTPNGINLLARIQHAIPSLRNNTCSQPLFTMNPFHQSALLPSSIHFNIKGICYLLSLSHLYLVSLHGIEHGEQKLQEIFASLATKLSYENKDALNHLKMLSAYNMDFHIDNPSATAVTKDIIPDPKLYQHNLDNDLTSLELAEILFTPSSSSEPYEYFQILEESKQGWHACSLIREYKNNPITQKKEVILHYFEPNYGFIKIDNKQLFIHCLLKMKKNNVGFSIHSINPLAIEGYKNRFGGDILDFLENRFIQEQELNIPLQSKQELTHKTTKVRLYNTVQQREKSLFPLIASLYKTWNTFDTALQTYNIMPPPIYLDGAGEKFTKETLYSLYQSADWKENLDYLSNPTRDIFSHNNLTSEDGSILQNILKHLLRKLYILYHNIDVEGKSHLINVKEQFLFSIQHLYTTLQKL